MDQSYLKQRLDYDPLTGEFRWLRYAAGRNRRAPPGSVAGSIGHVGYRIIQIDGVHYLAARLAWLYVHGAWPPDEIDHIDLNRSNDRIANLRPATHSENNAHSDRAVGKFGYRGVSLQKGGNRWRAEFWLEGTKMHLGTFATPELAAKAYDAAAAKHRPAFARFNFPREAAE